MNHKERKGQLHKEKNQGFTLVELIVSMAILMIVAGAIIAFFSFAMVQYERSSSEINVQTESRLAWTQLENLILETTNGISVSAKELNLYSEVEETASPATKKKERTRFYLDSDKKQIYMETYVWQDDAWKLDGDAALFASYVTDFSATLYDEQGNALDTNIANEHKPTKVEVTMAFENNERTFSTTNAVAIRNKEVVATNKMQLLFP